MFAYYGDELVHIPFVISMFSVFNPCNAPCAMPGTRSVKATAHQTDHITTLVGIGLISFQSETSF